MALLAYFLHGSTRGQPEEVTTTPPRENKYFGSFCQKQMDLEQEANLFLVRAVLVH